MTGSLLLHHSRGYLTEEDDLQRDRIIGFILALFLHTGLFAFGSFVFVRPVEFGVETGLSGIEVTLVAAPLEVLVPVEKAVSPVVIKSPMAQEKIVEEEIAQDKMAEPQIPVEERIEPAPITAAKESVPSVSLLEAKSWTEEMPVRKEEEIRPMVPRDDHVIGDGSSPVWGKDVTTFSSQAGAITQTRPNYLSNPVPSYPRSARERAEEGLVVLLVEVNKRGGADSIEIKQGSGFPLLDEAALKAVRRWKFSPAKKGWFTFQNFPKNTSKM